MTRDPQNKLEPYHVEQGKEWLAHNPETDNVYAGEWMEETVEKMYDGNIVFGFFDDPVRGPNKAATFSVDRMFHHTAIYGSNFTGKKLLTANILLQLAEKGMGFTVIENSGEITKRLKIALPEARENDFIEVSPDSPVSFNILQTYFEPGDEYYDFEVDCLVNELVESLKQGTYWGPRMDEAASLISRIVIHHPDGTIRDLEKLLDDSHREEYISEALVDDNIELSEEIANKTIEGLGNGDKDALRKRINNLIGDASEEALEIVASESDDARSFYWLLAESKITTLSSAQVGSDLNNFVEEGFVAGIKAAASVRKHMSEGAVVPHFLSICENDVLKSKRMETLVSQGRSVKLGLILCFPNLKNADEFEQYSETLHMNAGIQITFNPQSKSTAGKLAQIYGIGGNQLLDLDNGKFITRFYTDNNTLSEPFEVTSLGQLQPRDNNLGCENKSFSHPNDMF